MNCAACGAENREDRKFCRECGSALAQACPNCGAENEPGDKFCGDCGHPLQAEPTPEAAPPDSAAAEKRFVSVLFADLVGYTTYTEQRDSEDVRDMLKIYFARSREIVERFGGTIDKFIGDAVMGVWGATGAREDDAERAVRAALELVEMVSALGEELNHPELVLRAGVDSGSAVVGPGGNKEGMIVGDLVNTAARLQSIADPETVFVGSATHSVTSHAIDYESMGERTVKGKTESVTTWKALRVAGMLGGRAETELRHPPFVGREREMRLLKDELAAVETEQRARLVSIIGEGGIGKTRLADEFKNYIDGFTADVYWHQGRSPSYGDGVTFWALGEMIRRRAGIVEGEDPTRARTRLRTCLAEFVPGEDDRRWIEPRLEGLLGLAEMPPGQRDELFSALRSFFQHIALRGTTVLVFEDVHWADPGLVDFIAELVERSNRSPILIITLARPDLLERFPTWGSQQRNSMSVRLAPLSEDNMNQLMVEYLPGLGEDVTSRIVERAAGFPLYAVEMVRMLTASGELEERSGEWVFHGEADHLALPESLQAVIGARLDRLDGDQRQLLQDGAVLGQTFTLPALTALREASQPDLELLLRGLTQLEILDVEDDPRSPERGRHRFVQSLIREVAYRRLSRQDRRDKHLAAAAYFESFQDPELAGVVAGHFMDAYRASPKGADREELAERALRSLTDAAERAAQLGSHLQAMDLWEQAISMARNDDQVAAFRIKAAESAGSQAEVERGIEYIEAALRHYEAAGSIDGRRRAATTYSSILNSNYRSTEALEVISPVYDELDAVDDGVSIALAAEAARSLALTYNREAIEAVDRLLPGAAELGMSEIILEGLVTKATAFSWHRRPVEAQALLLGAATVAEDLGYLRTAGRAWNNLAAIEYVDSPRRAVAYSRKVTELVERVGDFGWIIRSAFDHAGSVARDGDYEAAAATLEQFDRDQLTEFWQHWYDIQTNLAALYSTGDTEIAEQLLGVLSEFDDVTDPQLRSGVDQIRCQALTATGRWDESFAVAAGIDHINIGLGIYEGIQVAAWASRLDWADLMAEYASENTNSGKLVDGTHMLIAAVRAALQDERDEAIRLFDDLLSLWEPIVLNFDLAMVRATYAMLIGQDHPAAAHAARQAQEWVKSTGSHGLAEVWAEGLSPAGAASAAG